MEEMEFLGVAEAGCLREMVDAPAIGPIRLRHVVAEINRYLAKRVLVDLAEEAGERVLQPRLLELQYEVDLGALRADRVEVEGARPMDAVEGGAVGCKIGMAVWWEEGG